MGAGMRHEGWEIALAGLIKNRRRAPFVWGQHDCCLFAADCAHTITGTDYAADLRGYDSASGAARLIAQRGGFEAMITDLLGQPIQVAQARRGDVAMVMQDGHPALAVVYGAELIAAGYIGLVHLPLAGAVVAWRVA